VNQKSNSDELLRLYTSLFRELLRAALESDPSVKYNFRALTPERQHAIEAAVTRRSEALAESFQDHLRRAGFKPGRVDKEALTQMVRDFLNKSARGVALDR
jgi:hypothetical protein